LKPIRIASGGNWIEPRVDGQKAHI
jgi:hypothetical protein